MIDVMRKIMSILYVWAHTLGIDSFTQHVAAVTCVVQNLNSKAAALPIDGERLPSLSCQYLSFFPLTFHHSQALALSN